MSCLLSRLLCSCSQMGRSQGGIHCSLTRQDQLPSAAVPLPVPGHGSLRQRKG